VGIAKVSEDAITLGATALPEPIEDAEYPWLFNKVHPFQFESTDVDPKSPVSSVRHEFDIGSMRIIKPSEGIAFIVQYQNSVGTPAMTLTLGIIRVLRGH